MKKQETSEFFNAIRIAFFLAIRYVTQTTKWQTILVIFIMTLTFLNLVVVSGILVGLMDGSLVGYKKYYAGDILISKSAEKDYIERANALRTILDAQPQVTAYSTRVIEGGTLEANFQKSVSQPNILPDRVGVSVTGINIDDERLVTDLPNALVEGSFITERDTTGVVLGARLLNRYFPAETGLQTISGIFPGDKVRLTVGDASREFIVRGIIKTKAGPMDTRVFMLQSELKSMLGRQNDTTDEFAVRIAPNANAEAVQARILAYGVGTNSLIRTTEEAIGEFLDEIRDTFNALGNIIGGISVVVASITIFIIIFITAITKRKYIGILKAIGVSEFAIELSYILLSIFYALIGITFGLLILYLILLPYFSANPIDFPFSDGILSVTTEGTFIRSVVLLVTTIIAGFIPARIIVKRNTLDAILGR
ncbi:ABC transporter permease [Candidatus Kaiserbacteria bacterium]|nr:MAG: ABC transporter permease [Candidatus Kaiserbacteria bacterium]